MRQPPRRRFVWIRRLLAVAAAVWIAAFGWTGWLAGRAEEAWRKGQIDEARSLLERAVPWRVRHGRVNDGLGLIALVQGDKTRAERHLAEARSAFLHPAAFGEGRVIKSLLRSGQLEAAAAYAAHRLAINGNASIAYYLGVAEAALGDLEKADGHFVRAMASGSWKERAAAQREQIAQRKKSGRFDTVRDRRGAGVAAIVARGGFPVLIQQDLSHLLTPTLQPLISKGPSLQARLALDLEFQRAAEAALGSRRGALVAISLETGGVLAAASQPRNGGSADTPRGRKGSAAYARTGGRSSASPARAGNGPAGSVAHGNGASGLPVALSGRFEPGSIIKMITLEAALRAGIDLSTLFPLECPGWVNVDGLIYRDWIRHGRVETVDEAVAVSCNIAFGRLGEQVGRDALDEALRRFGFSPTFDTAPPFKTDFPFEFGRLLNEDTAHPTYALWRRAVGLDSITVTPLHAALVSAALARGGVPVMPRLVEQTFNVLGEEQPGPEQTAPAVPPLPAPALAILRRSMEAAVTDSRGTARRAAIEGLSVAMKTGTSGEYPPGLDAVVIGFAPAEKPTIAWALIAQHAGKAEWEGARITREFLTRIQHRLKTGEAP